MLNSEAKLNSKIFSAKGGSASGGDNLELVPFRNGYGDGLVIAGERDKNVVVLCADLKESTRSHLFADKFPERFFELGVAEQNMAAVASGLGISGKIPFMSSYAAFSPGRNWEQIRTTISYNDANVKIAGSHAGISVGPDGATHQAVEDIAITRVMANMTVIVPCDSNEAEKATEAAVKIWGPVYIRLAREKTPVITTKETPFTPGRAEVFWESKKPEVAIIACGTLVHSALVAAKELEDEGIGTIVVNNHTVKPMDEDTILRVAKKTGAVVSVEEHQFAGGMGSAVAEVLAKKHPTLQEFVGLQGVFGESGPPDKLLKKYGMDVADIKRAVKKAKKRK